MSRNPVAVAVFVAVLASVLLVGTAGALSVSVTEEGSSISVDVTQDGEPVEDAKVTVSGVTGETPLDGDYATDEDGKVVFDEERVSELSGVVNLRITVDTGTSYKSALATVTRSPEIDSPPMGQRMSMNLQESVSGTRGTIESRLDTESRSEVHRTAESVEYLLMRLDDVQFEREALGRNLATGDITVTEFYLRAVENAGERMLIRSSLETQVMHLKEMDEDMLRDEGIDTDALDALVSEIEDDRGINTDRRLT